MPHRKKGNQSGRKGGSIIDEELNSPISAKPKKAKKVSRGKNKK